MLSQPAEAKRRSGWPGPLAETSDPGGAAGDHDSAIAPTGCAPSICEHRARMRLRPVKPGLLTNRTHKHVARRVALSLPSAASWLATMLRLAANWCAPLICTHHDMCASRAEESLLYGQHLRNMVRLKLTTSALPFPGEGFSQGRA